MKSFEKIQTLLPLAYLYLVVLGVIKESVCYYQLGINILKYSSIMDVLLSPISVITFHPLVTLIFIALFAYPFFQQRMFIKHHNKKWAKYVFGIKKEDFNVEDEASKDFLFNKLIYFYIPEGSHNIEIAPVGSVKFFEMIKNKRLNPKKD